MGPLDIALPPDSVYRALDAKVQRLVVTAHTLYGGRWDDCAEDIRRRQAGRPYLYRIDCALDDPLGWLHLLKDYEAARGEGFATVIVGER